MARRGGDSAILVHFWKDQSTPISNERKKSTNCLEKRMPKKDSLISPTRSVRTNECLTALRQAESGWLMCSDKFPRGRGCESSPPLVRSRCRRPVDAHAQTRRLRNRHDARLSESRQPFQDCSLPVLWSRHGGPPAGCRSTRSPAGHLFLMYAVGLDREREPFHGSGSRVTSAR